MSSPQTSITIRSISDDHNFIRRFAPLRTIHLLSSKQESSPNPYSYRKNSFSKYRSVLNAL